jgi:TRAP-type transport system small permease protein
MGGRPMIAKFIVKVLYVTCAVVIGILALIVLTQVVSRFFNYSLPGTEELSRLFIVWMTFLGSSIAVYERGHLAVNFFVKKSNDKIRPYLYLIVLGLFFLILTVYGFIFSYQSLDFTSSTLQLPMTIFYLAIPVSSLLSTYFIIQNFWLPQDESEAV